MHVCLSIWLESENETQIGVAGSAVIIDLRCNCNAFSSGLGRLDDEVLAADGVHGNRRAGGARPRLELPVRLLPPLGRRHGPRGRACR